MTAQSPSAPTECRTQHGSVAAPGRGRTPEPELHEAEDDLQVVAAALPQAARVVQQRRLQELLLLGVQQLQQGRRGQRRQQRLRCGETVQHESRHTRTPIPRPHTPPKSLAPAAPPRPSSPACPSGAGGAPAGATPGPGTGTRRAAPCGPPWPRHGRRAPPGAPALPPSAAAWPPAPPWRSGAPGRPSGPTCMQAERSMQR